MLLGRKLKKQSQDSTFSQSLECSYGPPCPQASWIPNIYAYSKDNRLTKERNVHEGLFSTDVQPVACTHTSVGTEEVLRHCHYPLVLFVCAFSKLPPHKGRRKATDLVICPTVTLMPLHMVVKQLGKVSGQLQDSRTICAVTKVYVFFQHV